MKAVPIFIEKVLDIPTRSDIPCNENRYRVVVTAKKFAPDREFPKGDSFVSISSHGLNVCVDEHHLDFVIDALLKARELYKK